MTDVSVRTASVADVPALNAIYNEYIVDSHVSFDTEPWTDDQRVAWFDQRISDGYPIVVAMLADDVVGAAWSGPWRDKAAYRTTAETTVVLAPAHSGAGIGPMLLTELMDALAAAGFTVAIAIVALPNEGSIAVHRKLGYEEAGVLRGVGFKDGRFHDTMILQRPITPY
ncbi:MAG: GNAT family N-acetyltransferase [Acidimicrobiia bacterium]